jgi:hypothetical protein
MNPEKWFFLTILYHGVYGDLFLTQKLHNANIYLQCHFIWRIPHLRDDSTDFTFQLSEHSLHFHLIKLRTLEWHPHMVGAFQRRVRQLVLMNLKVTKRNIMLTAFSGGHVTAAIFMRTVLKTFCTGIRDLWSNGILDKWDAVVDKRNQLLVYIACC